MIKVHTFNKAEKVETKTYHKDTCYSISELITKMGNEGFHFKGIVDSTLIFQRTTEWDYSYTQTS